MARDPEILTHLEWLGYLQPVGLVVSPPALVAAQAFPSKNFIPEHTQFLDLVEQVTVEGEDEPRPALRDFPRFATKILGGEPADILGGRRSPRPRESPSRSTTKRSACRMPSPSSRRTRAANASG